MNNQNLIDKMKVPTTKLVSYFKSKGITFKDNDGDFANVVFSNEKKELKIAHSCFYGFSRMGCATKENRDKNTIDFVPISDDLFMNGYMRNIIENYFYPKNK